MSPRAWIAFLQVELVWGAWGRPNAAPRCGADQRFPTATPTRTAPGANFVRPQPPCELRWTPATLVAFLQAELQFRAARAMMAASCPIPWLGGALHGRRCLA